MNKSFKVVFNKARGALMVVNEVTSSVQAKGTKTVIAAAVATMMVGGAVAAETQWVEAPKDAVVEAPADGKFTEASYLFKYADDKKKGDPVQFVLATKNTKFDKNLWVISEDADTSVNGIWASGAEVEVENAGNIYVTGKTSYKTKAMGAAAGATIVNSGTIVAKNAYGMIVGSGNGEKAQIVNAASGKIIVEGQGAAIELGGKNLNGTAVNNGVIEVVGNFDKDAKADTKWAHGVLINTATNTFENNGTINANAEGTFAIVVNDGATNTTLKFGEKSDVNGLIYLAKGTTDISFSGTKDLLKIKNAEGTTANLSIQNGADITLEDEMGSVYENVDVQNGKLTASIWQDDNHFGKVNIAKDGVFNITKLNSGGTADQTAADAKPHTKLLLAFDSDYTLDGGKFQVAGADYQGDLQVGAAYKDPSKGTGKLTINSGDYTFNNLKVGNAKGNIVTVNGGNLTVLGKLDANSFKGGAVHLNNGTTTVKGELLTHKTGDFQLNGGKLVTTAKNVFEKEPAAAVGATAEPTWKATTAWTNVKKNGGVLEIVETGFEYSLADLKAAQKLINGGETINTQLLLNGTLKLAEGEKLEASDVSGLVLADQVGVATDSVDTAFNVDKTTTIGAINFKAVTESQTNKDAESVALGNTAALTLVGNGGDVFQNLGAKVTTVEAGDLVLGTTESTGNVNVVTLKANNLTVEGNFTANDVVAKEGNINGVLTADTLKSETGVTVAGTLALNGKQDQDGKAQAEIDGKVTVNGGDDGIGILTTNRAAANGYLANLDAEEKVKNIVYVDRAMTFADGAQVTIGAVPTNSALLATAASNPAKLTVATDSQAVIDASAFVGSKEIVFANAEVDATAGEIFFVNVNKTGEIQVADKVTGTVDTDSIYVNAQLVENGTNGLVELAYNKGLVADETVDARLEGLFTKGASAKEMGILTALDTPEFFDESTNKYTAAGNKAFEQATSGNATAGVFNVAYDANAQVTDAIVRHQLATHTGMGAWADVFYAKNEAKEMYGTSGYSADIYGGVLGFDATFSCGATGGLAIAMGKADAESEGGVLANKLDSDFWGVSVYTAKDFSGLNVKADLGYMDFSNDFSGLGDASDASTITFGVRGDFTAYQNGAFSIAPHFGLRYTHIDTDAVAFNDAQTMNVFEAPIGVKFAGTFETTGWKVVPSYDFTIVPQFGDKEVEAFGTAGDITILNGGLVNNVFGIEASKGNLSFGLNGVYGVGAHDRSNTQINANVRYNF